MPRTRARRPGNGFWARRIAVGLAGILSIAAIPTIAERLRYPLIAYAPIDEPDFVTWRGQRVGPPRIAYPPLPVDTRLAPLRSPTPGRVADSAPPPPPVPQNYRPRPAIWQIGDRDTTIYLFGTVHVLPPGFQWRSPMLDRVVSQAGTLIVESVEERKAATLADAPPGPALPSLKSRVSPDHRIALKRFTDGLSPQAAASLDRMPTWIAAVTIGYIRSVRAGEIPGPGADDWLAGQFRSARKPVVPIDDSTRPPAATAAIPETDQRSMLDQALDAPDRNPEELRAPVHAWARGEIAAQSGGTDALTAATNRIWADNLVLRLRQPGTALFAAGAGHFAGPGSVIDLLRQRGITVKRVE
jgi:uncharacterized protein YbaP (TraB family)